MKTRLPQRILGALIALAGAAHAQDAYPARPIRLVVASAPGGLVDVITRLVAQKMSERLGQPIVIDNQAGGGTIVGIKAVKSAPADGYTLLATSNTITAVPAVRMDPGFDLLKDFAPIGPMVRSPWFMVVGPNQPDKSVPDFIARAKAKPGEFTFSSGGVGTTPHLAAESFLQRAGLKLLHVPYRGNGAAMPDVMSGRVSMMFEGVGSAAPKVRGGQLRPLGVSSTSRLAAFPDVPTIAEQGLPGFSNYVTIVLLAPAGTPKDIVTRLSGAMQGAVASKELRDRLENDGMEPQKVSPDEFGQYLKRELADMSKLVNDLGIKKD
ncbi:MAG TPA: tripartite tricarboxylate transporter substrate binding protein [Ramlibacter sp.]|nr:tripartite tricarboxylate transporter substrate binding protein [Ramlibacter sp.]